jgi:hypothetical protein
MASTCVSPIRGLAMRATRVNNCGCPVEGVTSSAVSCGFVSIGLSAQIDEGTPITVRTAAGELCINEPACRTLTRYDVTIEFCQVDPELFELMASTRVLTDYKGDSVGHTVGENIQCQTGFALEVWSQVAGAECDPGAPGSWYYWLLPFVTSGLIGGDITIEDGPVTFTFSGQTKKNACWGLGPYDVVAQDAALTPGPLLAPGVLDDEHLYARTVELAPPECACGYQELEIPVVVIPATASQTVAATETELSGLFLVVDDDQIEECHATIAAGLVIDTIPAAAASVPRGSVVQLRVSTGPC